MGSGTVTVRRDNGTTVLYDTSTTTSYFEGATATTSSSLAVGERVVLSVSTSTTPDDIIKLTIDVEEWMGHVSAVSGDVFALGPPGSARIVNTTTGTTFTYSNGTAAALSDVLVGEKVAAKGVTDAAPNTLDANRVVIWPAQLPLHVNGVITGLGAGTVTVLRNDGTTATYDTNSGTQYYEGALASTPSELADGEHVYLQLSTAGVPQNIDLLVIIVEEWTGIVSAVSGDAVTIGPTSVSRTVDTSMSTTFTYADGMSAALTDVLAGDKVVAKGVDGPTPKTLDATSVVIWPGNEPKKADGVITTLGTGTVTVRRDDGKTATYDTTMTTVYFEGPTATTSVALAVGENVDLVLTTSGVPQYVVTLTIQLVHFMGDVTLISGDTITLTQRHNGKTMSIVVSMGTSYTLARGGAAAFSEVLTGDQLSVTGVNGATADTIDATAIVIGSFR